MVYCIIYYSYSSLYSTAGCHYMYTGVRMATYYTVLSSAPLIQGGPPGILYICL
jgi:hypothetical protein